MCLKQDGSDRSSRWSPWENRWQTGLSARQCEKSRSFLDWDSGLLFTLIAVSMDSTTGDHFSAGWGVSSRNWGAHRLYTYPADLPSARELMHCFLRFSSNSTWSEYISQPEGATDNTFLTSAIDRDIHWLDSHVITLLTRKVKNKRPLFTYPSNLHAHWPINTMWKKSIQQHHSVWFPSILTTANTHPPCSKYNSRVSIVKM